MTDQDSKNVLRDIHAKIVKLLEKVAAFETTNRFHGTQIVDIEKRVTRTESKLHKLDITAAKTTYISDILSKLVWVVLTALVTFLVMRLV